MKKKLALILAFVLCVSLLAGCSAEGGGKEKPQGSQQSGSVEGKPTATTPGAANPSANPGTTNPGNDNPWADPSPAHTDTSPLPTNPGFVDPWKELFEPAKEYQVPSVLGRTVEELEANSAILGDFKLVVDSTVYSENYREGQICEQTPEAGSMVREGELVITVKISGGAWEKMTMPSVAYWDARQALQLLQNEMGLSVDVQEEFSDTVQQGCVTRFSPMEGMPVEKGGKVTIWVSKGPEVLKVIVPNLINARLEDVERQITSVGLTLGNVEYFYSDEYAEGRVFWQSIDTFREVDKGSVIDLWVSKGPALTAISFRRADDADFVLQAGESHTITLSFTPASWSGEVTWTSSDTSIATVDANGKVTNVNTSSTLRHVIITASAGGFSLESSVYCRGVSASDPPASQPPSGSGGVTVGKQGVIVNADSGLNVRSGPGTAYDRVGSLNNGTVVAVLEDAGSGWYKISFSGAGGAVMEGYVMGDYISTD